MYDHEKTGGYIYQAQLHHELTPRLGVEWAPIRDGLGHIAGVDEELIDRWRTEALAIDVDSLVLKLVTGERAVPSIDAEASTAGHPGSDAAELADTDDLPVVLATGRAGDVLLCHPFLMHAAGSHPASIRILGQPGIDHDAGCGTWRPDGDYSAVERAIRDGITDAGLPIPGIPPQPRIS